MLLQGLCSYTTQHYDCCSFMSQQAAASHRVMVWIVVQQQLAKASPFPTPFLPGSYHLAIWLVTRGGMSPRTGARRLGLVWLAGCCVRGTTMRRDLRSAFLRGLESPLSVDICCVHCCTRCRFSVWSFPQLCTLVCESGHTALGAPSLI